MVLFFLIDKILDFIKQCRYISLRIYNLNWFKMTDINNFKNKTFNCDNKEIFQQLPDNSIDLIITDPPYKDYQSNRPVVHEKVKKIHEYDFALPYFIEQSARVLKPGCHFYCWCDHISFPNIFLQLEQHKEKQKKKKLTIIYYIKIV